MQKRWERAVKVELGKGVDESFRREREAIRNLLREKGVKMVNLVSSPGSGKTSLIEAMASRVPDPSIVAVVEGDIETDLDAKRVREKGIRVVQINTKSTCHIQPGRLFETLGGMDLSGVRVLLVENVGNLVCPAEVDLGEDLRVVLLSVTEGDEKPLKYPFIFKTSHLLVLTKVDLLPFVDFDEERAVGAARALNPKIEVFRVSAKTGEGVGPLTERILSVNQRGD
ncbi:MAG: hydrogenase accessory protein HypB [Deltaproteobacteria bacterium]|nr:MAG: hydrogenase accessory protein HypB [Deltaproteobacteria bacterium]